MTETITNEKSRLMFRLALYQVIKKKGDQMMTSQERVLKMVKLIWMTKSRIIHAQISIPKQCQWWCPQWLGLNSLKPRPFLDIIPKVSQTKFHQIQISKSSYSGLNSTTKIWKTKKLEKNFWVTKRGNKRIANRGRF